MEISYIKTCKWILRYYEILRDTMSGTTTHYEVLEGTTGGTSSHFEILQGTQSIFARH